ncbi:hypothetical protein [Aneurinibacillus terranovensis]|uniref:hypothetical protein n=1 Tax=Aneurinibacillus terranovensis TaxID=278991 RepID=UPI000480E887|nr:hypothetical protein [Aneurinibacillus terranovensis]
MNTNLMQSAQKNIGNWMLINTKSGTYHGKIESVDGQGITVLLPSHYSPSGPIKVIEKSVKSQENLTAAQYYYGYPYRYPYYGGGYYPGYARWWLPFWWLLALGLLLWW